MRLMRIVGVVSMAGILSFAMAGSAAAADDVTLGNTGPDSNNEVTIENSSSVETTNYNNVQVTNLNLQVASTGDVSADHNTTVGGLESGDAANENDTTTAITIENAVANVPGEGGQGGGGGGGGGGGQGGGGAGGGPLALGGAGGGVLGASAGGLGGGGLLPEVGASQPVDVSAIRAAWNPAQEGSTANELVKRSRSISQAMLLAAALLSLMGAVATAIYSRRQEGRVR